MNPAHEFNTGFTLQGVVVLIGLLATVVGLIMHSRKIRRENEADARARNQELKDEITKHNDTVEKRLNVVETKVVDFIPRAEIESKIEHEKNNRTSSDQQLQRMLERHDDAIMHIKVDVGRIVERHASMANDMAEIKSLLKEQSREVAARLDKLSDQIAHGGSRS